MKAILITILKRYIGNINYLLLPLLLFTFVECRENSETSKTTNSEACDAVSGVAKFAGDTDKYCTSGTWICNDNDSSLSYEIKLSSDSVVMCSQNYLGLYKTYAGKCKQTGRHIYSFIATSCDGASTVRGSFDAIVDENNYLHFKINDRLDGFTANKELVMYKKGKAVEIKLPEKPTVVDLFKAAYPFTFDSLINDAYNLIVRNISIRSDKCDYKTVDAKNGYIFYYNGGAPGSAVEICYWNKRNDEKLLAVNIKTESPNIMPTYKVLWFVFNTAESTIKEIDQPFNLAIGNRAYSVELPRKGKNITVIYLNDEYSEMSRVTLKWNGTGFDC